MNDTDQTLTEEQPAEDERPGGHTEAGPTAGPAAARAATGNGDTELPDAGTAPGAGSASTGVAPESELEGDLDELVRTAAQRDQYLALAQRTQADFENYRKRVARDAQAAQERGVASLARELLPALDNLDRALAAAAVDDPLLDGVRLVRNELMAALARMGIECFSPLGETFDPSVHEAVATAQQPPEGAPSGTVVEVYQQGYRIGSNVIRPARVVVAA